MAGDVGQSDGKGSP
jgi:hypothetical protein